MSQASAELDHVCVCLRKHVLKLVAADAVQAQVCLHVCDALMRVMRAVFQFVNVPCTALVKVADLPFEFGEALFEGLHAAEHVALAIFYDVDRALHAVNCCEKVCHARRCGAEHWPRRG